MSNIPQDITERCYLVMTSPHHVLSHFTIAFFLLYLGPKIVQCDSIKVEYATSTTVDTAYISTYLYRSALSRGLMQGHLSRQLSLRFNSQCCYGAIRPLPSHRRYTCSVTSIEMTLHTPPVRRDRNDTASSQPIDESSW